jgi:hypothetical protein
MILRYPTNFADLFFYFTWRHRALLKTEVRPNRANDNGIISEQRNSAKHADESLNASIAQLREWIWI